MIRLEMQVATFKYFILVSQPLLSYSIHSPSESYFIFFIVGDNPYTFLLRIFVCVLQMTEITLAIYVIIHIMCELFLSSINRKVSTSTFFQ